MKKLWNEQQMYARLLYTCFKKRRAYFNIEDFLTIFL